MLMVWSQKTSHSTLRASCLCGSVCPGLQRWFLPAWCLQGHSLFLAASFIRARPSLDGSPFQTPSRRSGSVFNTSSILLFVTFSSPPLLSSRLLSDRSTSVFWGFFSYYFSSPDDFFHDFSRLNTANSSRSTQQIQLVMELIKDM